MKIAIVRNSAAGLVNHRFGQASPETYAEKTIVAVAEALRGEGHEVAVCEGDTTLFASLARFMPAGPAGRPGGMVFNMSYGIQGECRYTHVPSMLEMAGIPYTGSGPFGHSLALDKVVTKKLLIDAGIPTPRYAVLASGAHDPGDLRFPLVVKPKHESTSFGLRLVQDRAGLSRAVDAIVAQYRQEALVEEYIDGREVCAGLLGNDRMELLPLVEQDFRGRARRIVTWEDKFHKVADEPAKICPAPLDEALARRIREASLATFRACHCRDYARVDIRIDAAGSPYVLEINSMASLGASGSYVLAARTAGHSFATLAGRIVDVAHARYFDVPAPREAREGRRTNGGPETHGLPSSA
ncbi:MAG TPA: ATP-grasp domain-containing protein [Anaeromyxobacter sp.]